MQNLSIIGSVASEKSFEILNNFPIQMYEAHINAQGTKHDLAIQRSNINLRQSF